MEAPSVRFIPTDRSTEHGWNGNKPALCFMGERSAHCVVFLETEVGTIDLPLEVVAACRPVSDPFGPGVPYAPAKFVDRVLKSGKPLSLEARSLLQSMNGKRKPLPPNRPKVEARVSATAPPKAPLKTAGAELIIKLATEWKLPSPKLRRYLRSQGLHAPYTEEKSLRAVLKKLKKGKS
jgi:hypothetical protein